VRATPSFRSRPVIAPKRAANVGFRAIPAVPRQSMLTDGSQSDPLRTLNGAQRRSSFKPETYA